MKPQIFDIRHQLPRNGVFPTRPLGAVKILAVHYDGSDVQDGTNTLTLYRTEAQFHISKDWGGGAHGYGLEYHYCIARDGSIYQTEDEEALTWNATNANTLDLAIKVDSGPNTPPTRPQFAALEQLLDWLTTERPDIPAERSGVYGHGELVEYGNSTACPGAPLLDWVRAYRAGAASAPPAASRDDQLVTMLSVIGDVTYKEPVNLIQIRVLVQQAKALLGA